MAVGILRFWLVLWLAAFGLAAPALAATEGPRVYADLNEAGWRFQYGAQGEGVTRAGFDDSGWERVSVPHTWNRIGEYSLTRSAATNNKQGVGWYRLSYNAAPAAKNKRIYLDFAAVGAIADVWVNGTHIGQHKGAFSRFRFDVTAAWKPGAANLIAVKADNSKPAPGSSTEHVLPLAGDFFIHGGIYRGVQLITANDVGIDLLDYGGPGVYVGYVGDETTTVGTVVTGPQNMATGKVVVAVKVKIRNQSSATRQLALAAVAEYEIDSSVLRLPPLKSALTEFDLKPNSTKTVEVELRFDDSNRWNGVRNPVQHLITATLIERGVGRAKAGLREIDQVTTKFGTREFSVDPNTGATLNGKPIKLQGVSRHQDRAGRGYALTREDHAEDMALIKEMGANSVRMAHYQHADEWADEADKAGMLVWAEVPFVTTSSFTGGEGSKELWANAEQQLRELIRQNYNHPSIVMWSIGNEVDASALFGLTKEPPKSLALLQHLQKIAKEEDPTRPTIFADCCEHNRFGKEPEEKLAGTADLIGYNRYFGWYYPDPINARAQLAAEMDEFHKLHPTLPISISEYGAGGAISQFSDNPTAGFINSFGRPQPEAYESWVHEQSWPVIRDRNYIFGSWVWNMFDFASDLRNEGDAVDINTKGLVTMDRKVKKDAFYYYKAQWNPEPMIWLTDKRYVNRSYSVMDVKAYTNSPRATLQINGRDLSEVECPDRICIWKNVPLVPGENRVTVHSGELADKATFIGPDLAKGIRINAGTNAVTLIGGKQFGSDTFVTGGKAMLLNQTGLLARGAPKKVVDAPHPALFDYWREGEAFSYAIPVPDGKWTVTVHSFDPKSVAVAGQTMSVTANGKPALPAFSPAKEAGATLKGFSKSFPVVVKGGVLKLDFAGQGGKAVVAAIELTR